MERRLSRMGGIEVLGKRGRGQVDKTECADCRRTSGKAWISGISPSTHSFRAI